MTRKPRELTRDEAHALACLTATWQSPDTLGLSHVAVHSVFLLGLAQRKPVQVGKRWEHHYRAMTPPEAA
jgi:hypothetical protein